MTNTKEANNLKRELEQCREQANEYLSGWKRAQADLINYKKDEFKRLEEAIRFANEGFVIELVSFMDEFDIALNHLPEKVSTENNEWVKGLESIKEKFIKFLEQNGVKKIETIGEDFDPLKHESVGEVDSVGSLQAESGKALRLRSGQVTEEVQPGYEMEGKIIRPARVKVAK